MVADVHPDLFVFKTLIKSSLKLRMHLLKNKDGFLVVCPWKLPCSLTGPCQVTICPQMGPDGWFVSAQDPLFRMSQVLCSLLIQKRHFPF